MIKVRRKVLGEDTVEFVDGKQIDVIGQILNVGKPRFVDRSIVTRFETIFDQTRPFVQHCFLIEQTRPCAKIQPAQTILQPIGVQFQRSIDNRQLFVVQRFDFLFFALWLVEERLIIDQISPSIERLRLFSNGDVQLFETCINPDEPIADRIVRRLDLLMKITLNSFFARGFDRRCAQRSLAAESHAVARNARGV